MSSGRGGPIALDAMGGDFAPAATVAGAAQACADSGLDVVLVGDRAALEAEWERALAAAEGTDVRLPRIVDAPEAVGMDEDPATALRAKPRASVRVAADLVASGEASAMVSAGSTGATLAAALLALGRVPGIRRPAVGAVLPRALLGPPSSPEEAPAGDGAREVVLVDAGGTADASAQMLVTYAEMGVAYARALGVASPRVGLLNVGAEPGKGSAAVREAYDLLAGPDGMLGFEGNVEPAGVLDGEVEVVVADGFAGNVFLKTVEAVARRVSGDGSGVQAPGAALLLGVRGEVLVAHGASGPAEIAAALRTAASVGSAGLAEAVTAALSGGTGGAA